MRGFTALANRRKIRKLSKNLVALPMRGPLHLNYTSFANKNLVTCILYRNFFLRDSETIFKLYYLNQKIMEKYAARYK